MTAFPPDWDGSDQMRPMKTLLRPRSDHNGGEAVEHLDHDRLRDRLGAPPVSCVQIEDARLITANYSDRPGVCIIKRNRKTAMAMNRPPAVTGGTAGVPVDLVRRAAETAKICQVPCCS